MFSLVKNIHVYRYFTYKTVSEKNQEDSTKVSADLANTLASELNWKTHFPRLHFFQIYFPPQFLPLLTPTQICFHGNVSTLKFHHWNVYIQSTSISTALALKLLLENLSSPLHSLDELHKCLLGTCFISLPCTVQGFLHRTLLILLTFDTF